MKPCDLTDCEHWKQRLSPLEFSVHCLACLRFIKEDLYEPKKEEETKDPRGN